MANAEETHQVLYLQVGIRWQRLKP